MATATAAAQRNDLAVRGEGAGDLHRAPVSAPVLDLRDVFYLAERVAASGFFKDVNSVDKAFTLMMIAQARGIHPMDAMLQYDIIEGRPAMKAAAIQARFLAGGGRIEILRLDAREARALFSHPKYQPTPVERFVTIEQFAKSYAVGKDGTLKKNWRESPEDMLWARLVSKNCRKIDPGITTGIPSSDELQDDLAAGAGPGPALPSPARPSHVEPMVWGQREEGVDGRPYHALAAAAAEALADRFAADGLGPCPVGAREVHAHLIHAAVQQGLCEPPRDRRSLTVLTALAAVYDRHRDWLRVELNHLLDSALEAAARAARAVPDPDPVRDPDPDPDPDDYNGGGETGREPGAEG